MVTILIVEDDLNTRKLLSAILKAHGFRYLTAGNGAEALELLHEVPVDLVITDIMMPVMDGFQLTREIRKFHEQMPVLMLTARQLPVDKRNGFLAGTDDYITKPADEEEMILRIRALLRRAQIASARKITLGRVTLDYDRFSVGREGEAPVQLPQKEFLLLFKLLSYPEKIFTRLQLMDDIWGMDSTSGEHTVNVHINRLRERFQSWPEFEIVTVRGLGYKAVKKV